MPKDKKIYQKIGTFQELGMEWLNKNNPPDDESYDVDSLTEDIVVKSAMLRDFLITSLKNQIEERQRLLKELLSKQFR